jgi:protein-tyrosine phosphatase
MPQSLLDVQVVHNIRHMGHLSTRSGQRVASDIVRSATLSGLVDAGARTLVEAGITTIVDLRSSTELEVRPTMDLTAYEMRTVHASVAEYDASPLEIREFKGYAHRYRELLELGRGGFRRLFETIAASESGVLFHCSAGKDRTGLAAALLLELAGVADDDIVEDYALSGGLLEPLFDTWLPRFREEGVSLEEARRLMASDPDDMALTVEYVRTTWGSAEDYMTDIGMQKSRVEALRRRLAA